MNRSINTDTKSHRNHNHIIDADFSKLKEMRQATQNAKSQQRSHAKRNATSQEIFWLAERNDQRTKNDDNNNRRKAKAIILHRLNHIRKNELRRECA